MFGFINTHANERILERYGSRHGSIINATGTGTQLIFRRSAWESSASGYDNIFDANGELTVTAFAPGGRPLNPHPMEIGGVKRMLSGRCFRYLKKPTIKLDISVIGNSLDFYRLSMLSSLYGNTSIFDMALDCEIVSHSAPGSNIILVNGMMVDADPIMGIDGNSKISDKVFSFEFESFTSVSWSAQNYDLSEKNGWDRFLENTGLDGIGDIYKKADFT